MQADDSIADKAVTNRKYKPSYKEDIKNIIMIGIVLSVIGIILTIGFGIYSIWSYRKSRKKISLEFKDVQCYSLFKNDIARLNIEISYNGKILSNALILLRARIINNGQTDIDESRLHNPLKIISQKEFTWLDAKSIIEPEGATTSVQIINENAIQIEWDLLKSEEFIEFEAIVKVSDNLPKDMEESESTVFINGITFDYRITDLNTIQKYEIIPKKHKQKRTAIITIFGGVLLLCIGYFSYIDFLPLRLHRIDYSIHSDSCKITTKIVAINNDEIELTSIKDKKDKTVSIDNFNKTFKIDSIEIVSSPDLISWISIFFGITYILMGSLLLLKIELRERKKEKEKKFTNAST